MNKLFKKIIFLLAIIFLGCTPTFVNAKTGVIDATAGLILRKGPGTTYSRITTISYQKLVTVNSSKATDDNSTGCGSKTWYNISYGSYTGYVCSTYVIINETPTEEEVTSSEMAKMTDKEFDDYLESQGFPESYKTKLKTLHKAHPNWVFKAKKAKYTWSNALSQENANGRSLLSVNSSGVTNGLQGYLSTDSPNYDYATDKFKAYDGSTWFQASSATVAYYMDPRNFLTESGILMFEDLKYYSSYQTVDVVKKILYTDFFKPYVNYFIEAATKHNVSPVYLAALSRQEVGLNSSTATSGKAGTYDGVNYNGYYNFYNIGASSGKNPVYNGLAYSKKSGWTTPQKAIVDGAGWIVNGYINAGQYTPYFQKWNTAPESTSGIWHQYMTNVKSQVSPAATTAASYRSMNIIDEALVFSIPVYAGMPTSTSLPKTGNPNNWLKTLKVDETAVKNFAGSTTTYNLNEVEYSKTSIKISATTVNNKASIDGDGTINLTVGQNKLQVIVTAENGAKKTYTLNITRKEKPADIIIDPTTEPKIVEILNKVSVKNNDTNIYGINLGTTADTLKKNIINQNANSTVKITDKNNKEKTTKLATGDKITITSADETKTYEVIIYGDIDGDGAINAKDLLVVRKYLLKEKTLSGPFLQAAKLNRGTQISAKDLLILRKYLLGTTKISQV